MMESMRAWVPLCAAAFEQYRMGGANLSAAALETVRRMLGGEEVDQKSSGMAPREWRELMAVLGRE